MTLENVCTMSQVIMELRVIVLYQPDEYIGMALPSNLKKDYSPALQAVLKYKVVLPTFRYYQW